jgi:hypothetical protein
LELGDRKRMIPPTDNNTTNFIITDNSSEIVTRTKVLPHDLIEPLVIIARIKGFKGVDDYVLHLIEHELESIRDGGQGIDDLGEYVIKYIEKIIGPDVEFKTGEEQEEEEEEKEDEEVGKEET